MPKSVTVRDLDKAVRCYHWTNRKWFKENNSRVRVSGIADPGPGAQQKASELGISYFETLDELIATGLDALVIATPTQTHAAIALQAVSAEIPLFIEKPLALTVR